MQLWGVHVEAAEAPLLLSARDGRLLKPVSLQHRLSPDRLRANLADLFQVCQL